MNSKKSHHNIPDKNDGTRVSASPFNAVKFDLGIILILAVFVLITVSAIEPRFIGQIGYLAAYGVGCMIWLLVKTRRISRSADPNVKT